MKINKWYIILPIVVVLVVASYFFLSKKGVPVKEIPIKNEVVKKTVSASGTVKSWDEADLSFPTLGTVYDIAVEKGEIVKKGTYLAALNNIVESQTAQSVKDTRDVAKLDLELYIENYETNKDAVGGKDEYEIQKRKYQELLSKAEASYQAQLGSLGKTYLYAPFEGKIIDIYFEEGETAMAGSTIIKIANEDKKIFEIELDQEDFGYLKQGQDVEITLDSYENTIFEGKVLQLPSYINQERSADFILDIDLVGENKDKALIGMEGDAYIILAKTDGEVNALTFDEIKYDINDDSYVYIIENNRVIKKEIEIGLKGDIYTEIITDIKKPIIQESDAKFKIEEGTKVKLVKQ